MKKKLLITGIVLAGILIVFFTAFAIRYQKMKSTIAAFEIKDVDLSQIEDGDYQGQAGDFLADVTAQVTVADNAITDIVIIKQEGGPGYEALDTIDRIIEKQSPKVDATSGATGSSLCIQAAVYRALTESVKQETE